MAKIEGRPSISASVVIALTESEAGALDALAGYGVDVFLETFYAKMGRAYLEPYEAGLRSLFEAVHGGPCSVKNVLDRARDARQVFTGEKIAKSRE
jgi:hypothetical protein